MAYTSSQAADASSRGSGPIFFGKLVRGRYAGWWTFEVRDFRGDQPLGTGAIYAILFERPDDEFCERAVVRFRGNLDRAVPQIVARYGGYEVYIPTTGYPLPEAS